MAPNVTPETQTGGVQPTHVGGRPDLPGEPPRQQGKTFRTRLLVRLGGLTGVAFFLPLVVLLACIVIRKGTLGTWIACAIFAAMVVAISRDVVHDWRDRIDIDEQGLQVRIRGSEGYMAWANVIYTSLSEDPDHRWALLLDSAEGRLTLPVERFDRRAVWDIVRANVQPSALDIQTHRNRPEVQAWLQSAHEQVTSLTEPLVTRDAPFLTIVMWLFMVLWVGAAIASVWLWSNPWALVIFAPLAILFAVQVLSLGKIEWTSEAVVRIEPIGIYEIRWDEIERIEATYDFSALCLIGHGKVLALLGSGYWSGKDASRARELVGLQIALYQIPVHYSAGALFRFSKGTRVLRPTRKH